MLVLIFISFIFLRFYGAEGKLCNDVTVYFHYQLSTQEGDIALEWSSSRSLNACEMIVGFGNIEQKKKVNDLKPLPLFIFPLYHWVALHVVCTARLNV